MTGALSLGWYIKISDMNGTFLDLSDVLKVQQENDNVQSSDTRYDETIVGRIGNMYSRQRDNADQIKLLLEGMPTELSHIEKDGQSLPLNVDRTYT